MHRFIEKYAKSIKDADVLKLIKNKMDEAYKECKEQDEDYIETLDEVVEMITLYKQLKEH